MMHAEAPHPNCAYMWLEHSINPKLQGDLAAWFGSVPAVTSACKGNALLTDQGCETNGIGSFEKIHFWRTPVSKCTSQADGCVPYHRWGAPCRILATPSGVPNDTDAGTSGVATGDRRFVTQPATASGLCRPRGDCRAFAASACGAFGDAVVRA
eukprot:gene16618-22538_t